MHTFQEILAALSSFWADKGCLITQPYDVEKGAGTSNPTTFLRALGPEPYKAAYIEPCRRPKDGRYGQTPNRTQHYFQYQVILKPSPDNIIELYLDSLSAIGMDINQHDIRFVHDDWENPTLGAWGLGWEVWIDGMEMTQFTYFQSVAGIQLQPITGEITYGLERIAMAIQKVNSFFDIRWNKEITYGDIYKENEIQWSEYNFSTQNDRMWMTHFRDFQQEAKHLIAKQLPIPAYDFVIKASHAFNMLDAKGVISVTERASYIASIRELAKAVAEEYILFREKKGFPLLQKQAKADTISNRASSNLSPLTDVESNPQHNKLIVEIGVEELPALFIPIAIAQFEKNIRELFQKEKILFESVEVYATPRRITLIATKIAGEIPEEIVQKKGPPADTIWDPATKALTDVGIGFLASLNIFSDLQAIPTKEAIEKEGLAFGLSLKNIQGTSYLFVTTKKPKKLVHTILQEALPGTISGIQFPKSMRWGDFALQFARPIRWLLALLDGTIIPFQLGHLTASNKTFGSRSLTNSEQIEIPNANLYLPLIEKAGVVLSQKRRQEMIEEELIAILKPLKAQTVLTQKVLRQVVYLVEKPYVSLLSFDAHFLKAPKEVLIAEMVEHQKYFPVESLENELLPYFIVVTNRPLNSEIEIGNKKVLFARLQDGLFLWNEDKQIPLSSFREKLHSIIYQTGAGTLFDKTERMSKIALDLQQEAKIAHIKNDDLKKAAHLSKADLTTQLVGEFPDLQGVVGAHLARAEGLPEHIASALSDHWLPNQDRGALPKDPIGEIIALSDKLDTITTFFALGIKPTSSHDPFALRRAALGVVRIIVEHKREIPLAKAIAIAGMHSFAGIDEKRSSEILKFILIRAKTYFQERGYAKESIEAVCSEESLIDQESLTNIELKILALQDLRIDSDAFKKFHEMMKRCLGQQQLFFEKADMHTLEQTTYIQKAEQQLYKAIITVNTHFSEYAAVQEWKQALFSLLDLAGPIDALFSEVKILSDEKEERERRIMLIQMAFITLHRFGDMKRFLGFK